MKIASIFFSFILFFNYGWSQAQPQINILSTPEVDNSHKITERAVASAEKPSKDTVHRLELEEKINEAVKIWNQSFTFAQWVEQLAIAKEEKTFLHSILKKEKMEKEKPIQVEFIPKNSKFIIHWAEGKRSLSILAMEPIFVLYDGLKVMDFQPHEGLQSLFPEFKMKKNKENPIDKNKKKATTSRFSFFISEAFAQSTTQSQANPKQVLNSNIKSPSPFPSQIQNKSELIPSTPQNSPTPSTPAVIIPSATTLNPTTDPFFADPWGRQNKERADRQLLIEKAAKKQKKFNQNLLKFFLFGIGIAIAGPYIWNTTAHAINNHWGTEGYFEQKKDVAEIIEIFPKIDATIFNGREIKVTNFSCTNRLSLNPAGLSTIRYQYPNKNANDEYTYEGKKFNEITLDLFDTPNMKADIINGKEKDLSDKVKALEECCQKKPCEDWLNQRMKVENSDSDVQSFIEKMKDEASGGDK